MESLHVCHNTIVYNLEYNVGIENVEFESYISMFIMTCYCDLFFDYFPKYFPLYNYFRYWLIYINIPLRTMIVIPGSKTIHTKSVKAATRIQQNV